MRGLWSVSDGSTNNSPPGAKIGFDVQVSSSGCLSVHPIVLFFFSFSFSSSHTAKSRLGIWDSEEPPTTGELELRSSLQSTSSPCTWTVMITSESRDASHSSIHITIRTHAFKSHLTPFDPRPAPHVSIPDTGPATRSFSLGTGGGGIGIEELVKSDPDYRHPLRHRATTSKLIDLISRFKKSCGGSRRSAGIGGTENFTENLTENLVEFESRHSLDRDRDRNRKMGEDILQVQGQGQLPSPPSSSCQLGTDMGPSPPHMPNASPGRSVAPTNTNTQSLHVSSRDPAATGVIGSRIPLENKGPVRSADVFYSAARDLGSPKAANSYPTGTITSSLSKRLG